MTRPPGQLVRDYAGRLVWASDAMLAEVPGGTEYARSEAQALATIFAAFPATQIIETTDTHHPRGSA